MTTRPRDHARRRVPSPGTRSRRIYDLLKQGMTVKEIHASIGGSRGSISVLKWKFNHPEEANARQQEDRVN